VLEIPGCQCMFGEAAFLATKTFTLRMGAIVSIFRLLLCLCCICRRIAADEPPAATTHTSYVPLRDRQAPAPVHVSRYYGQRDAAGLRHGMGLHMSLAGHVSACGQWAHGVLIAPTWVWRGFLQADAPLSPQARKADAIGVDGNFYMGSTSGPLHLPNGAGKVVGPRGDRVWEGTFIDGLQEGAGTFYFENGGFYTGHFVKDNFEGVGCMKYADGNSFDGEWKNDKKHGIGRFTETDGRSFEGQWVDDQRKGLGVEFSLSDRAARLQCGLWSERFVRSCPVPRSVLPVDSKYLTAAMHAAGPNILLLPSGGYYTGDTNAAHQRHGVGSEYSADGTLVQRGTWREDVLVREPASRDAIV